MERELSGEERWSEGPEGEGWDEALGYACRLKRWGERPQGQALTLSGATHRGRSLVRLYGAAVEAGPGAGTGACAQPPQRGPGQWRKARPERGSFCGGASKVVAEKRDEQRPTVQHLPTSIIITTFAYAFFST